jgi:parallel beta-helix repeat protein
MSEQRNPIIIAITLALVSAFVLGGVSFALFPSQLNPLALSEKRSVLLTLSSTSSMPSSLLGDDIFNIFVTKPLDGVCIQSDGSLNSTTAPIIRDGDTYRFTDDIVNQTIVIQRDNIVIDGAGHTLQGYRRDILNALEGIRIEGRSNVTIENLNITMFWQSIWIQNGVDITINNNTIVDTNSGVSANSVKNTRIKGNSFNNVTIAIDLTNWYGFDPSVNNFVSSNNVTDATTGVSLAFSSSNTVTGNNFANVLDPIVTGEDAIVTWNSMINGMNGISVASHSVVSQNTILNFTESGLSIGGNDSIIFENFIASCSNAVSMNSGDSFLIENNTIYHNNFVNNTESLLLWDNASQFVNFWDHGEQGNYWSNYNGTDANGDGIGDTPFTIAPFSVDRYPLMQPYNPQAASDQAIQATLFGAAGITAAVGISALTFSIVSKKTLSKRTPEGNASSI